MVYKKDTTLKAVETFNAQIQTLDIPGELKVGYSPIGFVRCGRAACRMMEIKFKVGKETGGKKLESPHSLKSNEMAEVRAGKSVANPHSTPLTPAGPRTPKPPPLPHWRTGGVPAPAAARRRLFQELRGPLSHCLSRRQHCGHAREGGVRRAQGGQEVTGQVGATAMSA